MHPLALERLLRVEGAFILVDHDTILVERIVTVPVEFLCKEPLSRAEGVRRINDDQVVGVSLGTDETKPVLMIDRHPFIRQTARDLRDIFPAHFHQKRIRFHHIDLLYGIVFDQLPDHTSVAPSDDQHFLHIRMHRHGHVGDHLMVDKLVPFRQHQVPVHNKDLPKVLRLKDVDPLDLALGAEKLFLDLDGQLHAVCMHIGKPHFHLSSPLSIACSCNIRQHSIQHRTDCARAPGPLPQAW